MTSWRAFKERFEQEAAKIIGGFYDTVRDARDARARAPLRRVRRGERAARARDADARRPPPARPPGQEKNRKALLKAADTGKTEDVQRYISMGVDVDGHKHSVRLCSKERSSQRETTSLDTTHTRGGADAVPLPAARALGRKMTSSTIRAAIRATL